MSKKEKETTPDGKNMPQLFHWDPPTNWDPSSGSDVNEDDDDVPKDSQVLGNMVVAGLSPEDLSFKDQAGPSPRDPLPVPARAENNETSIVATTNFDPDCLSFKDQARGPSNEGGKIRKSSSNNRPVDELELVGNEEGLPFAFNVENLEPISAHAAPSSSLVANQRFKILALCGFATVVVIGVVVGVVLGPWGGSDSTPQLTGQAQQPPTRAPFPLLSPTQTPSRRPEKCEIDVDLGCTLSDGLTSCSAVPPPITNCVQTIIFALSLRNRGPVPLNLTAFTFSAISTDAATADLLDDLGPTTLQVGFDDTVRFPREYNICLGSFVQVFAEGNSGECNSTHVIKIPRCGTNCVTCARIVPVAIGGPCSGECAACGCNFAVTECSTQ